MILFLQCLHCNSEVPSSRGRPVGKVSRAASSRGLTIGPGETGTELVEGVLITTEGRVLDSDGPPSTTLPSRQFPGLLCFGGGFLSLMVPVGLSLVSFLGATLIVDSSSLATEGVLVSDL